uniref:Uncharacterized protein n=1 Tax=Anguilla anguilla TaxID=7936 RepID=A0A0E9Q3D2_ANGAN
MDKNRNQKLTDSFSWGVGGG